MKAVCMTFFGLRSLQVGGDGVSGSGLGTDSDSTVGGKPQGQPRMNPPENVLGAGHQVGSPAHERWTGAASRI